jgi:pyridoxal phosphate enzyme (YggS family)
MSEKINLSPIQLAYQEIQARVIRARDASPYRQKVTLLAVSKVQPLDAIRALYELGQRDFDENYAQEMLNKATTLASEGKRDIRWHFIGHLQTNKVKLILPHVYAIHSVDSIRLAQEISKRAGAENPPRNIIIFLEVNLNSETSKAGISLAQVDALAESVRSLPHLDLRGLMAIPDPKLGAQNLRKAFSSLREKTQALHLPEISMGMSSDFEIAIAEGATQVRIGTALFGARRNP